MRLTTFLGILMLAFYANTTYAQWTAYTSANSPVRDNAGVAHVCSDPEGDKVFVLSKDTSYHLYEFDRQNGWVDHPEYDAMLDSINMIYDARVRNNVLWCLTSAGLKSYTNGTWTHINYKPGHPAANFAILAIDKQNGIWFAGGPGGHGITYYSTNGAWSHFNTTTHPAFKLDFGLSDIKLDETAGIVWIGTNCMNEDAGVYSYNIAQNTFTLFDNGNPKYRCIHAVEPAKNKVFVGTSSFSSVRILESNGIFSQSLDQPRVTWTTKMSLDPVDSDAVWVITDVGLMHFKDTLDFGLFNHSNSVLDGFMNTLATEKMTNDSVRVWVGSSQGLYSYSYKGDDIGTGIDDPDIELEHITVFPNPSRSVFTFNAPGVQKVEVADITGRQIAFSSSIVFETTSIDLSGHPKGLYFLTITTYKGSCSRKLFLME